MLGDSAPPIGSFHGASILAPHFPPFPTSSFSFPSHSSQIPNFHLISPPSHSVSCADRSSTSGRPSWRFLSRSFTPIHRRKYSHNHFFESPTFIHHANPISPSTGVKWSSCVSANIFITICLFQGSISTFTFLDHRPSHSVTVALKCDAHYRHSTAATIL